MSISSCNRGLSIVLFYAAAIIAPAQNLTTLLDFNGTNGANPEYMSLVQDTGGNFYGTTFEGGANGNGTIFKITPQGALTTLHSFSYAEGAVPAAGLTPYGGDFYGSTTKGGAHGDGAIFKVTSAGTFTTLLSFGQTDGAAPYGALIVARDGNLYGTTRYGGAQGHGTVFKISPAGALTTLHSFVGTDGARPFAGLVEASDGTLYGTTTYGGAHHYGTVFKITPAGALTSLHSFGGPDGLTPFAGLIAAADGNFYGTTQAGGAANAGTVFVITAKGVLTTLHSFDTTNGALPYGGLVQGADGNFYGTTSNGGAHGAGTIFEITPGGALATLHNFDSTDGAQPDGALLEAGGVLYGATSFGGATNHGTLFRLAVPASNITYNISGVLGPNLNMGPDCLKLNGQTANVTVTVSASLVPISTTSNSATYQLPKGAVKVIIGTTLSFTNAKPWKMKYTLAATDQLTLSGPGPVVNSIPTSFVINASLVAGSFPSSVLKHPAPLNPADQGEPISQPASYLSYLYTSTCAASPEVSANTKVGLSGNANSTPAAPPF